MVAAAAMSRERAKIVAVGLVPFGLPREIAYAKELELRISRSYGPGRYDAGFEEKGLDYPAGYVRWTETRNLEAFLHAIGVGHVAVSTLVTHRYGLDEAPAAYDMLVSKEGSRPLGVVIRYASDSAGSKCGYGANSDSSSRRIGSSGGKYELKSPVGSGRSR